MGKFRANIDVTVNGKKFLAGEKIKEELSSQDAEFLLRENYIKEIPVLPQNAGKSVKAVKKEGGGKSEQPPEEKKESGE